MAFGPEVLSELAPQPLDVVARRVRDGDILLCSATDPFSRLIGWSTRSPWSHVALAYTWPATGRILVFECVQHLGVHAIALERFVSQTSTGRHPYPGRILLARHRRVPAAERLRPLADFAVDAMGARFSPLEIARIAARIALGRRERRMPRPLRPANEFICSEFADQCLQAVDVHIRWDGLGFIAPADFALDPQVEAIAQIQTR